MSACSSGYLRSDKVNIPPQSEESKTPGTKALLQFAEAEREILSVYSMLTYKINHSSSLSTWQSKKVRSSQLGSDEYKIYTSYTTNTTTPQFQAKDICFMYRVTTCNISVSAPFFVHNYTSRELQTGTNINIYVC